MNLLRYDCHSSKECVTNNSDHRSLTCFSIASARISRAALYVLWRFFLARNEAVRGYFSYTSVPRCKNLTLTSSLYTANQCLRVIRTVFTLIPSLDMSVCASHPGRRTINFATDEDLGVRSRLILSARLSRDNTPRNECQLYPAGLSSVAVNTDKGN